MLQGPPEQLVGDRFRALEAGLATTPQPVVTVFVFAPRQGKRWQLALDGVELADQPDRDLTEPGVGVCSFEELPADMGPVSTPVSSWTLSPVWV